jgi:hypothetical protein
MWKKPHDGLNVTSLHSGAASQLSQLLESVMKGESDGKR